MSLMKVFSGSCLSLDDHDYHMPPLEERKHVLGDGSDFFDAENRPVQPPSKTIKKVFSGSMLDLDEAAEGASNDEEGDGSSGFDRIDSPGSGSNGGSSNKTDPSFSSILNRHKAKVNGGSDQSSGAANAAPTARKPGDAAAGPNGKAAVLVLGCAGYVAGHVVLTLLKQGYRVHGAVSSLRDQKELQSTFGQLPQEVRPLLSLVEVDLLSAASLSDAIRKNQVRYVVHCGIPNVKVTQQNVGESSVQTIRALFDALRALKGGSVERVVLTGSYAAVANPLEQCPRPTGWNEGDWNEKATPDTDAYAYAKVTAEKEAWRLRSIAKVELVVILPSVVLGPSLTNEVSEATRLVRDFAKGSRYFPFAPAMYWNFVDVRDVANAHLRALEAPSAANQRFIVSRANVSLAELGRMIRKAQPHLFAPIWTAPTLLTLVIAPIWNAKVSIGYLRRNLGLRRRLDGSKAEKQLLGGVASSSSASASASPQEMTDLQTTVSDTLAELVAQQHLPTREQAPPGLHPSIVLGSMTLLAFGVGMAAWQRMRRK